MHTYVCIYDMHAYILHTLHMHSLQIYTVHIHTHTHLPVTEIHNLIEMDYIRAKGKRVRHYLKWQAGMYDSIYLIPSLCCHCCPAPFTTTTQTVRIITDDDTNDDDDHEANDNDHDRTLTDDNE